MNKIRQRISFIWDFSFCKATISKNFTLNTLYKIRQCYMMVVCIGNVSSRRVKRACIGPLQYCTSRTILSSRNPTYLWVVYSFLHHPFIYVSCVGSSSIRLRIFPVDMEWHMVPFVKDGTFSHLSSNAFSLFVLYICMNIRFSTLLLLLPSPKTIFFIVICVVLSVLPYKITPNW